MLYLLWDSKLVQRPSFRISKFKSSLCLSLLQILLESAASLFLSRCYCILKMRRTHCSSNTVEWQTVFYNVGSLHVWEFAVFPLFGSTCITLSIRGSIDHFLAFRVFLLNLFVLFIIHRLILCRFLINLHLLVFLLLIFIWLLNFDFF